MHSSSHSNHHIQTHNSVHPSSPLIVVQQSSHTNTQQCPPIFSSHRCTTIVTYKHTTVSTHLLLSLSYSNCHIQTQNSVHPSSLLIVVQQSPHTNTQQHSPIFSTHCHTAIVTYKHTTVSTHLLFSLLYSNHHIQTQNSVHPSSPLFIVQQSPHTNTKQCPPIFSSLHRTAIATYKHKTVSTIFSSHCRTAIATYKHTTVSTHLLSSLYSNRHTQQCPPIFSSHCRTAIVTYKHTTVSTHLLFSLSYSNCHIQTHNSVHPSSLLIVVQQSPHTNTKQCTPIFSSHCRTAIATYKHTTVSTHLLLSSSYSNRHIQTHNSVHPSSLLIVVQQLPHTNTQQCPPIFSTHRRTAIVTHNSAHPSSLLIVVQQSSHTNTQQCPPIFSSHCCTAIATYKHKTVSTHLIFSLSYSNRHIQTHNSVHPSSPLIVVQQSSHTNTQQHSPIFSTHRRTAIVTY